MAKVRKNMSLTRELLQTKVVMMEAVALANYRQQLLGNFNHHISSETLLDDILPSERHYMLTYKKGTQEVTAIQFFDEAGMLVEESADGDMVAAHAPSEEEERVLMLELTGPVTRCGGMCSYGSMEIRDILLEYAGDESVKGLVLITDTPGGTAFALHDFAQGMAAWNEAGKRSIQWIDGMCCSAGVACGCQCEKVIAMNQKDIVGCIGAMMAGWMVADGTVDQSGMRYVDITAEQTPDKNREFREAADGNYKLLQADVDACCEDFLATIERCRPQIKPDQRTGKTYDAGSVIGSLVDGIGTLDMAIRYALTGEEGWSTGEAVATEATLEPESKCKPEDGCDPEKKDKCKPEDACDPEKKDKCKPEDGCPCDPEEDPEKDPDEQNDANNPSGEESLDNQNTETMTTIQAERIAARTGMTAEEILAIANEETVATPAQEETAEAPATQEEVTEAPAQEETVEAPAAQEEEAPATEEPVTPAAQEEEVPATEEPAAQVEEDPATQVEEEAQTEEEAPAAQAEEKNPASPADPTAALLEQMQQQMTAMQQQMTAMQNQQVQTEQALANANAQLAAAQKEAATLRAAAPAPAMPAAPAHTSPIASTPATRISENMTPAEKLEAYKKRGEQLKRNR